MLNEITPDVLRNHCEKVKNRGAAASAVRVHDIVGSVFTYAKARGANAKTQRIMWHRQLSQCLLQESVPFQKEKLASFLTPLKMHKLPIH